MVKGILVKKTPAFTIDLFYIYEKLQLSQYNN